MDPIFKPGRELSRQLAEAIEPKLRTLYPETPFALALVGSGSDVLGFDTARSMDHDWGPRLTVIVPDDRRGDIREQIDKRIQEVLPSDVGGFPTRFSRHDDGTLYPDNGGDIHRLDVESVQSLLRGRLQIDALEKISDAVWLSTPMQSLLELTSGEVFIDDAGEITAMREALAFYPDHIWRYQLAGMWMRVSQIQPFLGRTAEVGDDSGSAQIAAALSRDFMRIGLLQSRQYAPYSKWLGTAFARTYVSESLSPHVTAAMQAPAWQERELHINTAGSMLIGQLNRLRLIPEVDVAPMQFHSRPFHVLPAEQIVSLLRQSLGDHQILTLQATLGGIDAITDSTDALGSREFQIAYRSMLESALH